MHIFQVKEMIDTEITERRTYLTSHVTIFVRAAYEYVIRLSVPLLCALGPSFAGFHFNHGQGQFFSDFHKLPPSSKESFGSPFAGRVERARIDWVGSLLKESAFRERFFVAAFLEFFVLDPLV
jgi:hypothetical protein